MLSPVDMILRLFRGICGRGCPRIVPCYPQSKQLGMAMSCEATSDAYKFYLWRDIPLLVVAMSFAEKSSVPAKHPWSRPRWRFEWVSHRQDYYPVRSNIECATLSAAVSIRNPSFDVRNMPGNRHDPVGSRPLWEPGWSGCNFHHLDTDADTHRDRRLEDSLQVIDAKVASIKLGHRPAVMSCQPRVCSALILIRPPATL